MSRGYAFAQTDGDRDRRIRQYMSLVHRVARRIVRRLPSMVDLQDLQQVGVIGLIDAIDRYDSSRSERFEAYAEYRIKGAILDHLRQVDHLSRRHRGRINALREASERLRSELGEEPSSDALAKDMDMTTEQVEALRTEASSSWMSYDEAGGNSESGGSGSGGAILASLERADDILDEVAQREAHEMLAGGISQLPERLQLLLSLYYKEALTYREIADVLSVTVGRVSQLHTEATKRLKVLLAESMDME
jgi:RNA polymerase sigma factor for flagellar operon FliA